MNNSRRDLLKQSAAAAVGLTGLSMMHPRQLLAQLSSGEQAEPPTLVTIYLRGGADALNTIIPYGDRLYYEYRPTISIAPPGAESVGENERVIPINRYFGFHPAARELHDLYTRDLLAPVVNAGSTHPTRSHFDAQDFMERAAPGARAVTEGWLNRYLSTTSQGALDRSLRAISLQPTLPRSLRGSYPVLAVPTSGGQHAMDVFEAMYECEGMAEVRRAQALASGAPSDGPDGLSAAGAPVQTSESANEEQIVRAGEEGIRKLRYLNETLRNGPATRPGVRYPNHQIGSQLRQVAKVIKSNVGMEVAAVDYNGWDHHAYQGGVNGTFGRMMGNLSQAIHAFVQDLDARMAKVCVLVMTEFGRTVRENGNNGTDHGHGGLMFVVSGALKPCPLPAGVYGEWKGLEMRDLYQARDLPSEVDFRDIFAEILRKMFRFDADAHQFFPDYDADERAIDLLSSLYPDVAEGRSRRG